MNTTSTAAMKFSVGGCHIAGEGCRSSAAVLCRPAWLHARRRLFAERRVPRRAAHSTGYPTVLAKLGVAGLGGGGGETKDRDQKAARVGPPENKTPPGLSSHPFFSP